MAIPFPARGDVIKIYRQIMKASNPTLRGKRSRSRTLESPFINQLRMEFRAGATIDDPKAAWKAMGVATDLGAMLNASITHADALFDGGWCLNVQQQEAVASASRFVGFDMPTQYDNVDDAEAAIEAATQEGAFDPEAINKYEEIDIFGESAGVTHER